MLLKQNRVANGLPNQPGLLAERLKARFEGLPAAKKQQYDDLFATKYSYRSSIGSLPLLYLLSFGCEIDFYDLNSIWEKHCQAWQYQGKKSKPQELALFGFIYQWSSFLHAEGDLDYFYWPNLGSDQALQNEALKALIAMNKDQMVKASNVIQTLQKKLINNGLEIDLLCYRITENVLKLDDWDEEDEIWSIKFISLHTKHLIKFWPQKVQALC